MAEDANESLAVLEGHTCNVTGVAIVPDADGSGFLVASLSGTQNTWVPGRLIVYKPVSPVAIT